MKSLSAIAAALTAAGLVLVAVNAAEPGPGPNTEATAHHSIEDVAFLAGAWEGEVFGGVGEEYWTQPRAGSMLGVFRLIDDDETTITEYFIVHESEDGVWLRFKHFNTRFDTWDTDGPLTFRLIEASPERALFRSPDPAQAPNLLEYRLDGERLVVRVAGPADDGGEEPDQFTVRFTRLAD